jgi:hypothetical protein
VLGLDFINDIGDGETLLSSTWDVLVVAGVDPNAKVLQGPSITAVPKDGSLKTGTIQRVGGVLPGVTYRLRAQVITNRGNVVSGWSHVRGIGSAT